MFLSKEEVLRDKICRYDDRPKTEEGLAAKTSPNRCSSSDMQFTWNNQSCDLLVLPR